LSTRTAFFIFTAVNGRAANAASENRRITSVIQSTFIWSSRLFVKLRLQASTDERGRRKSEHYQIRQTEHCGSLPSATARGHGNINIIVAHRKDENEPSASVRLLMIPKTSTVLSPPRSSMSVTVALLVTQLTEADDDVAPTGRVIIWIWGWWDVRLIFRALASCSPRKYQIFWVCRSIMGHIKLILNPLVIGMIAPKVSSATVYCLIYGVRIFGSPRRRYQESRGHLPKISEGPHVKVLNRKVLFTLGLGFILTGTSAAPRRRRICLARGGWSGVPNLMAVDLFFVFARTGSASPTIPPGGLCM
jgi:hypothetical protein